MAKQLTLSDRIIIERGINNQFTFATIARMLERSPSSISREEKRYRLIIKSTSSHNGNDCTKRMTCLRNKLCLDAPKNGCNISRCKYCPDYNCIEFCPAYVSTNCELLNKPPYVCVSEKLYNYIDSSVFKVRNVTLPKKVVYRKRKKPKILTRMKCKYSQERTYEDFESYINSQDNSKIHRFKPIYKRANSFDNTTYK